MKKKMLRKKHTFVFLLWGHSDMMSSYLGVFQTPRPPPPDDIIYGRNVNQIQINTALLNTITAAPQVTYLLTKDFV